jgi:hypothetical protein
VAQQQSSTNNEPIQYVVRIHNAAGDHVMTTIDGEVVELDRRLIESDRTEGPNGRGPIGPYSGRTGLEAGGEVYHEERGAVPLWAQRLIVSLIACTVWSLVFCAAVLLDKVLR